MKITNIFKLTSLALFAAFVLSSCGTSVNQPKSGKEVFVKYFAAFDPSKDQSTVRGIDDQLAGFGDNDAAALKEMKAQGMAAYGQKKYAEAVNFFENYVTKNTTDLQVPFYLGICYMATDKMDKAEGQFNRLLQAPNGLYFDNAQWYEALILVQKENYEKAKELLSKIVANPNHFFHEQASDMLDQVEYIMTH